MAKVLLFVCLWTLVSAHQHYQGKIPNGHRIPHPCDVNNPVWDAVGHKNNIGGGVRNRFGEDFALNEFQWTKLLCKADSDGDGRTNGEELGDPDCSWVPGAELNNAPLSHPGICEPPDDPKCIERNGFLSCTGDTFECEAINESDTISYTVKLPRRSKVPAKHSTVICMDFEFPHDEVHHLVATTPDIETDGVTKSIVVYACTKGHVQPLRSPYECETEAMACEHVIAVWRKGLQGECHGPDVGLPVGGSINSGYKYATLQVRWHNPGLLDNITGSSGLNFYLTPNLRPHNAGYFYFGPRHLAIPPHRTDYSVHGSLDNKCTREVLLGPIKLLKVLGDMQLSGRSQGTNLVKDKAVVNYLSQDDPYRLEHAQSHRFPESIEVLPGDELTINCTYDTSKKDLTTFWGEGYGDEKCFAHVLYYPKENIVNPHFKSWGSISFCHMLLGTHQGCDLKLLSDSNHLEGVLLKKNVKEKCRPGTCLEECLTYVKDAKQNPCFHGDANIYLRTPINLTSEERQAHALHYAAVDSCDARLAREKCELMMPGGGTTSRLRLPLLCATFILQELFIVYLSFAA